MDQQLETGLGPLQASITAKLQQRFDPQELQVVNESHMHSVPVNSETHFKVTMVTDDFEGLRAVKRHQLIYGTLSEELKNGVHALAIHAYTPDEWQQQGQAPESPQCHSKQ